MEVPLIPDEEKKSESGIGPIAGTVIVVILLALGGIYFFITQEMKLHQQPVNEQVNS